MIRKIRLRHFILCMLVASSIVFYFATSKNDEEQNNTLNIELDCDTIHIGTVLLKRTDNITDFYTIVKAILLYRRNPLHIHILADNESEIIVKTLFETWPIKQVFVNIDNLNTLPKNVHWIKNEDTSPELIRMMFPLFLPEDVRNVCVMDSGLFCVGDIDKLWHSQYLQSKQIRSTNAISSFLRGESESSVKSKVLTEPVVKVIDPSNIKICDTRIQIVSNEFGMSDIWIINVANVRTSKIYNNFIDSLYNNGTHSIDLDSMLTSLNVFHRTIDVAHFSCNPINRIENSTKLSSAYNTVVEFNSEILLDLSYCSSDHTIQSIPKIGIKECDNVEQVNVKYFNYRTLLQVVKYEYKPQQHDITMVTQMSTDKLAVFEIICERWPGPISVTLYLEEVDLIRVMNIIQQSTILKERKNIAYHIVFKKGKYYPVNKLRNIALKYISTPYVFLNDVDFVPGPNVYSDAKNHIKTMKTMKKKALVIPAFQAMNDKVITPVNLSQTMEMWNKGEIIPFHQEYFPKGHRATDYKTWKTAKAPYKIKWEQYYEPYVIVDSSVPKYDERFVGYDWNKIQHIAKLDAVGYEFIVLPNTFLVHKHHKKSTDFYKLQTIEYIPCLIAIRKLFAKELNIKYKRNYKF